MPWAKMPRSSNCSDNRIHSSASPTISGIIWLRLLWRFSMAIPKGVTPERRDLILSRQQDWQWGDVYVPSIMATKEEAPPGSRPSGLSFNKFGREIQLLSEPERFVTLVALHHLGPRRDRPFIPVDCASIPESLFESTRLRPRSRCLHSCAKRSERTRRSGGGWNTAPG